jgi:putative oxidoreductase
MLTKLFSVRKEPLAVDVILLLTRLAIGYAFVLIGWGKIQHPTNWMQGISFAPAWQVLAAVAEFGGGIALFLGLLTRLGALGIACVMTVAIGVHIFSFGHPYVNLTGGPSYQVAAAYLLIVLLLLVLGPGRFSMDYLLFNGTSLKGKLSANRNEELTVLGGA